MASYYKYAEKKVENEVNWGAISKGLTDSLTAEADSRVQRKAAIDKASDDDLKKMMDRPQGQYMAENSRISGFTEQAQKSQLASLRLLKSGGITEQEYNLRTNNLRTGTDMAFSLSQDYQDQYQIHMDRLKPDENGIIQASAGEPMMLGQLEQFGNPAESEYYVNPLTGEVQLAITAKEGESGQVKIKDGNFNLMSLNGAKNIIYQQLNRYQSDTVTTGIAEGIGERIETLIGTNDKTGYFVTEEDAYKSLMGKDGKLSTTPEAKALKDQINASFADDNARMSFLVDTLKTHEGTAYNLVYDESEQGGANILMKKNKQGAWEADIDAEQQGLIEKGMLGLIKNKLDQKIKITGDSRVQTEDQAEGRRIQRANLAENKANKNKGVKKEVGYLGTINTALTGDAPSSQASIDAMITRANIIYGRSANLPSIENAVRSEDGKTLTVTKMNADGNIGEAIPYDISDPNKAGEVLLELFYPDVEGSYDQLLSEYNKTQGGFTSKTIANPDYEVDDLGVSNGQPETIPNPNYKGASVSGKTQSETTNTKKINTFRNAVIEGDALDGSEDVGVAEILTKTKPAEGGVDWSAVELLFGIGTTALVRAKQMKENSSTIFSLLEDQLKGFKMDLKATDGGLVIDIPSVLNEKLTLKSLRGNDNATAYQYAIEKIYNAAVNGEKIDVSIFN
jgi:hypothetical protein